MYLGFSFGSRSRLKGSIFSSGLCGASLAITSGVGVLGACQVVLVLTVSNSKRFMGFEQSPMVVH